MTSSENVVTLNTAYLYYVASKIWRKLQEHSCCRQFIKIVHIYKPKYSKKQFRIKQDELGGWGQSSLVDDLLGSVVGALDALLC